MNEEVGASSETVDRRAAAFKSLVVDSFPAAGAWRIHYRGAALSPRPVLVDRANSDGWNRFEVVKPPAGAPELDEMPGAVYCGSERRTSFAEVLAHLRWPRSEALEQLAVEAFGLDSDDTPIADEWEALGFAPAGVVPPEWRSKREISRLAHRQEEPASYVDVEHHESMAALNVVCRNVLLQHKAIPLNVSLLRSTQRTLTCGIASEVANCSLTLRDGARAAGLRYLSQHSTDWECWVTWPAREFSGLHVLETEVVESEDPDLLYILSLFHLELSPDA